MLNKCISLDNIMELKILTPINKKINNKKNKKVQFNVQTNKNQNYLIFNILFLII